MTPALLLALLAPLDVCPTPADLIHAREVLAMPVGGPVPPASVRLLAACRRVGVEAELVDERSGRMLDPTRFRMELDWVREEQAELADTPPVAWAERLPPLGVLRAGLVFNRAFRRGLADRLAWEADRADVLSLAAAETDYLYRVWDAAADARADHYVTCRRRAMRRLRDLIGEDDFLAGVLPPCAPDWRFTDR